MLKNHQEGIALSSFYEVQKNLEWSLEEEEKRKLWVKEHILLDTATFPALLGYPTAETVDKIKKAFKQELGGRFEFVAGLGLGQGTETTSKEIHHSLLRDQSIAVLHGPMIPNQKLFEKDREMGAVSILQRYVRDKLARIDTNSLARVRKLFNLAKQTGIEKLNMHITDAILADNCDKFLNYTNALSKKNNIKTCFENVIFLADSRIKEKYQPIWEIAYNPIAMYDYFQNHKFDNLQLCIDTAHLKASQTYLRKQKDIDCQSQADQLDLMTVAKELQKRARMTGKNSINDILGHIHLVDYCQCGTDDNEDFEALAIGEGENQDLKNFISFLYDVNYQNTITLELAPPNCNLTKQELEKLRKLNILGQGRTFKYKKFANLLIQSLARWGKQTVGLSPNIEKEKAQVATSLNYIYQALGINKRK